MSRYYSHKYPSLSRWSSYWHQISETMALAGNDILEIGVGDKIVSLYLKALSLNVVTLDISGKLHPDIVASVENMPLDKDSFDIVIVAEVLEHLPFDNFKKCLREIYRVTRKYAVISLPQQGRLFMFSLKIPGLPYFKFIKKYSTNKINAYDQKSGHYWEIGKKDFHPKKIESMIKEVGFIILKSFIAFENPYHHFYILSKNKLTD